MTTCNPPQITSANSATVVAGTPFSFTVTTCATAPPVIKASHLPRGLHLVNNYDGTATISGTPAIHDGGVSVATITASVRGQALASQAMTFTVDNYPVFKSKPKYLARTGTAFNYLVKTQYGYPVPTLTTPSSLPAGVALVDNGDGTGYLSGTPGALTGGVYSIDLVATNGIGSPVHQAFTLTVYQAPTITSANNVTIASGVAMTPFTVTDAAYPLPSLRASGLPAGIHLTNNFDYTGTMSGTPSPRDLPGTYNVTITAAGRSGYITQAFTLTLTP